MAKKNAYNVEDLIRAGIMTKEGVVIDPVRLGRLDSDAGVALEKEKLKRAEEAERRMLEKPGLIDKLLDGINRVTGLIQRKNEKKKEQQKVLEQKKKQQMSASRVA